MQTYFKIDIFYLCLKSRPRVDCWLLPTKTFNFGIYALIFYQNFLLSVLTHPPPLTPTPNYLYWETHYYYHLPVYNIHHILCRLTIVMRSEWNEWLYETNTESVTDIHVQFYWYKNDRVSFFPNYLTCLAIFTLFILVVITTNSQVIEAWYDTNMIVINLTLFESQFSINCVSQTFGIRESGKTETDVCLAGGVCLCSAHRD